MWMPRRDPDAEAINAYWNAVNRGAPPEELARFAENVDPSLIDAIDRARALHRRRRPSPAFANRLEQHLMSTFNATYAGSVPLRPPTIRPTNGRLRAPAARQGAFAAGGIRRSRLRVALPIALVLLLLGLAGGWALIGAPRLWPDNAPHAAVPAPQLTQQPCGHVPIAGTPVGQQTPVDQNVATPIATDSASVSFVWSSTDDETSRHTLGNMAIDPQCRLWVMDFTNNDFLIFDLNGKLLETWGSKGPADGEFDFGGNDYYGGIAFSADGGFYVADYGNRRIQQFAADRSFIRSWQTTNAAGQMVTPVYIAMGPDGNVYVSPEGPKPLQIYTPDGKLIREFGDSSEDGGPIAVDAKGNVWQMAGATGVHIRGHSSNGDLIADYDVTDRVGAFAFGIAVDAEGRIYIADENKSQAHVYDSSGNWLLTWGSQGSEPGQFTIPIWMAIDGAGGVYIGERSHPRIQRFDVRFGGVSP